MFAHNVFLLCYNGNGVVSVGEKRLREKQNITLLHAFSMVAEGLDAKLGGRGCQERSLVFKPWTVGCNFHPAVVGSPNSKVAKG